MKIEKAKISALKLNPANPRTIKDEKFAQLVRSVRDFPQMLEIRPIVVNKKMEVLGGNMRLRACIEAGLLEVPIIRAESLTDDQQREFIIKDNVGFGEWDWGALANEWDAAELSDWGLDVPVFDEAGGETPGGDPFNDPGITGANSYGVIVMCESEGTQEAAFRDLQGMGYKCKIVVV